MLFNQLRSLSCSSYDAKFVQQFGDNALRKIKFENENILMRRFTNAETKSEHSKVSKTPLRAKVFCSENVQLPSGSKSEESPNCCGTKEILFESEMHNYDEIKFRVK